MAPRDRHPASFRSASPPSILCPPPYLLRAMASSRAEGRRQEELTKERQRMREQYEKQKAALVEETEKARPSSNRFVGQNDSMEESLKRSTVGLVRLEEFQARRKEIQEAKEREAAMTSELRYVFLAWRGFIVRLFEGRGERENGALKGCSSCLGTNKRRPRSVRKRKSLLCPSP